MVSFAPTTIDKLAVAFAELLSVTCTVNVAVPAADGVPPMLPAALRVSPAGSAPVAIVQVYPTVPPLAVRVCWYAVPTTPAGSDEVPMVSPTPTTIDKLAVALAELLSVTCTVKFAVPAAVGVPPMLPLALSASPAGSAPVVIVQLYPPVPPLAVRVCW